MRSIPRLIAGFSIQLLIRLQLPTFLSRDSGASRGLTRRATALYRARVPALATEPCFAGLGLTVTIGLAHGVAP